MSTTRTNFKNGVSASIYTNTLKLIKGNTIRDKFLLIADNALFTDEADTAGGYLRIAHGSQNVNVSFIKSALPTGMFLKDNGTWAQVLPTQSGNSGKFLITNGTNVSWSSITAGTLNSSFLFASGQGIDTSSTAGNDVLNIGVTNANIINYGNSSTRHIFMGTAIYEQQTNSYVTDKILTLNVGGGAATGLDTGFEIEEEGNVAAYIKTNSSRTGFSIKAPVSGYKVDLNTNLLTNNRALSFPNTSGTLVTASLSDQMVPYSYLGSLIGSSDFSFNSASKRLTVPQLQVTHATDVGIMVNNGAADDKIHFYRNGGKSFSLLHNTAQISLYNITDSAHMLVVKNNGNIGIGSVAVSSKFVVNGSSFFGSDSKATAFVDIAASTAGGASLRIRGGSHPTSPNNGDMWYVSAEGYRMWIEGRPTSFYKVTTGYNGIYFAESPSTNNYALYGNNTNTFVNAHTLAGFEIGGKVVLSINSSVIANSLPVTFATGSESAAPLTLTSGALRATPAAGSLEFLTDRLYFTKTSGTKRETIAYLSDIPSGASPGGAWNNIQFNYENAFAGSDNLQWNDATLSFKTTGSAIFGINTLDDPTAYVDIAPANSSKASLRIRGGSNPTSPNSGDMWYVSDEGYKMWIEGRPTSFNKVTTDYNGIYFAESPSTNNYALYGNDTNTFVNAHSLAGFEIGGNAVFSVNSSVIVNSLPVTFATGSESAAPLTLTSGALRATPAAGSLEFLTDRLYFTKTSGTKRETIAYLSDISSGASPGGAWNNIQFNYENTFAGSDNLQWNDATLSFKTTGSAIFGINTLDDPTAYVDIAPATATRASLRIRPSTERPGFRNDGDIWLNENGVYLYMSGRILKFMIYDEGDGLQGPY